MTDETIKEVLAIFVEKAKEIYGAKLKKIILYGSCARGDYGQDSDIDIMVLLDVTLEAIPEERNKMLDVSDELDQQYDVVLAPVFQSYTLYERYKHASVFFQNIEKEGVIFA